MSDKLENHGKPWMLADLRDLDAMYGNGQTYSDMAWTFGRARGAIWAALRHFGIMDKRGSRRTQASRDKIATRRRVFHNNKLLTTPRTDQAGEKATAPK